MKSLLAILLLCFGLSASAQDPNFSQFFVSPLTLNPALTGKFSGNFRVAGNYRDQWPLINKAFITNTTSFDFPVLKSRLSDLDTWGVGFMAMSDKTANGLLASNQFSFTTAYHKGLDENGLNQLGAGFQLTYNSKMLDGTRLNFEDELDAQGGWTIPSLETINNRMLNMNYMDVSAGLLFNGSSDGYNNYYFGISGYHLNKPRESFTGDVFYTLFPRYTAHGGGAIPIGDATKTIYLSALYSTQGGASNFVGGGALGIALNDEPDNPATVFAGAWTRYNNINDAVIPYIGLEFNGFRLGVSYDVTVSNLKTAAQSRGGMEISLIYIKRPAGYKMLPCPRF